MSRRLITLFALIVFTLTGLGLPALAQGVVAQTSAIEAPCHEMPATDMGHKKTPVPRKDCDLGCQCALSHCPATLIVTPVMALSEPLAMRVNFATASTLALEATAPEGLKRPPRA
jgi:hypothetical protein